MNQLEQIDRYLDSANGNSLEPTMSLKRKYKNSRISNDLSEPDLSEPDFKKEINKQIDSWAMEFEKESMSKDEVLKIYNLIVDYYTAAAIAAFDNGRRTLNH